MPTANAPPTNPADPLTQYWSKPVSELATVENTEISPAQAERHTIFSLLAMAMVSDAWNGNKHGPWGDYPFRSSQQVQDGLYGGDRYGDRYLGHNIACLAVDAVGEIIDFDFNHNEIFNSSVEHAEARLVRRIFNLNESYDHWQTVDSRQILDVPYATVLSGVTIYTTLESCAQCSGIMTLGNVKAILFLQSDPGQYRVGNILYNLSNPASVTHPSVPATAQPSVQPQKYGAPEPINAEVFGFEPKAALDGAYEAYVAALKDDPTKYFYKPPAGMPIDRSNSITSFLCTDDAKSIFDAAANRLMAVTLDFPGFQPGGVESADAKTNAAVLDQARRFRAYSAGVGRRGTPHK